MFLFPAALLAQTCTVTSPSTCPSTGSPAAGDQFGDTVTWTSSPANLYAAPEGGQDFKDFISGEQTAFASISASFSSAPANNILYSAEFSPLSQQFFLSDPAASCPSAGAPTCLYDNVAYAKAFADSLFRPLGQGGVGLYATDINIDPSPWFASSEYATRCAAYSSGSVAAGTACFKPSSDIGSVLNGMYSTEIAVLQYINKTYPQVRIHFSPTPSPDVFNVCGLTSVSSHTEAAIEACMVPLYQAIVATVNTTRFTALHEPAGVWGIYCGSGCPFLSSPANVDLFLRNAALAIKSASPSTAVGAGGTFEDMGLSGGQYVCPNAGGSSNFWCNFTTVDPFLDYVGMDVYPASTQPAAEYGSLVGTATPADGTYDFMAQRASVAPYALPLYVNESSALRWSIPGGSVGSGEPDTYLGSGWIGWTATDSWTGWLTSTATAWAQHIGAQGWDYFDAFSLACQSTDPNNTHTAPNTDHFMAICMPALPSVSQKGTAYGQLAKSSVPPFSVRSATAGQVVALAPGSIVTAYGAGLASSTATAETAPPISLAGTSVTVTDAAGTVASAPLFYVSSSQVNFELPADMAPGIATVTISSVDATSNQRASIVIGTVSPGLFTLNGSGLVAAWVLPVLNGVQQPLQSVYQVTSGNVVGFPIDVAASNEQFYLEIYGTGFRNSKTVTATVGGISVPVLFAGAAPGYLGEDQINIGPIPASLAGKGAVSVVLTADGKVANVGSVTIQ
jgi:uncharacterized protein (TIGR03437 family)